MVRMSVCMTAVAVLVASVALVSAQQAAQQAKEERTQASIVKVDATKNMITLKMKDKDGKDLEKTFELKNDVKYFDEAGKVITFDAYRVGNQVIVVQKEGRIIELRKDKGLLDNKNVKDK